MSENIRTYTFNVPGFIPGIPGNWPAGSWATVNEDTKQILDFGPKPAMSNSDAPSEPDTPVESEQESSQKPVESGQDNPVPPALSNQPG